MFLPDVTNIRSPMTLAPVVRPTSCWIEPRYSTFGDMTASGGGDAAEAVVATSSRASVASMAARRILILRGCNAARAQNLRPRTVRSGRGARSAGRHGRRGPPHKATAARGALLGPRRARELLRGAA